MTIVVLALLALATVVGLVYRARYGRLRAAGGDLPTGLLQDFVHLPWPLG